MRASHGISADLNEFGRTNARVYACSRSDTRDCAALSQSELAVRQRTLDDVADAAHPPVDRGAPWRREHVDDRLLERLAKHCDKRFGEDGVADPRGRDDQNAFGHRLGRRPIGGNEETRAIRPLLSVTSTLSVPLGGAPCKR